MNTRDKFIAQFGTPPRIDPGAVVLTMVMVALAVAGTAVGIILFM